MRIAQLAPVEESVPPHQYGGIEIVVQQVCDGLVARGHDVTLFATGDSRTHAKLSPIVPEAIRTSSEISKVTDQKSYLEMMKNIAQGKAFSLISKGNFDIVHSHVSWRVFPYVELLSIPFVFTLHIPLNDGFKQLAYAAFPHLNFVSISNSQRVPLPQLHYIDTVYNATDTNLYSFDPHGGDDLLFLGRSSVVKSPHMAIEVAHALGKKLRLVMKIEKINVSDFSYYQSKVLPNIDEKTIIKIEEVDFEEKLRYYQTARCLLFPIQWEEPFGLVMTESMATGTPVVAYARGSVPEIIKDGVTGFLVNSSDSDKRGEWIVKKTGIEGLCEAAQRIYSMSSKDYQGMRLACRKHVEDNFTIEKMVGGYESVYKKVLNV